MKLNILFVMSFCGALNRMPQQEPGQGITVGQLEPRECGDLLTGDKGSKNKDKRYCRAK